MQRIGTGIRDPLLDFDLMLELYPSGPPLTLQINKLGVILASGSQSVVLDQLVLIVLHVILIHIKVSEPLLCTMGIINNNNKYELCFDKGDPYFPKNLEAIMDLLTIFKKSF